MKILRAIISLTIIVLIIRYGCDSETPVAVNDAPPIEQPEAEPAPAPAPAAPVFEPRKPEKTLEGQLFLTGMLADLDSFRGTEEFRSMGFGTASKYNRWLVEIQNAKSRPDYAKFSMDEKYAVGLLMNLGMAYNTSDGAETRSTRGLRAEVMKQISP